MWPKQKCEWAWNVFVTAAFEYDTPKIVHIQNKKVGVLYRLFQLGIVGFMIGYSIIYSKGYQNTQSVIGAVTTKLKGVQYYNATGGVPFLQNCAAINGPLVLDPADYVVPPEQPNSFFVMTNMWVTCSQTYGTCVEQDPSLASKCSGPADCTPQSTIKGNGPTTGVCNNQTRTCDVYAWCPTEYEITKITYMGPKINAENFTVLIKNSIEFPNLDPDFFKKNYISNGDLANCINSLSGNNYCPIFKLADIVNMISQAPKNFSNLATKGAVVVLTIRWDCDLDMSLDHCNPRYSARRLDTTPLDTPNSSGGFNFRFAKYWYDSNGVQYRTLVKAYGILFIVELVGQGGKFSFTAMIVKLGSTIALLGIAAVLSDMVVLYILQKRHLYYRQKYQMVNDEDDGGGDGGNILHNSEEKHQVVNDDRGGGGNLLNNDEEGPLLNK